MDATGLHVLLESHRLFSSVGAELVIATESSAVKRLLDVCAGVASDLRASRPT